MTLLILDHVQRSVVEASAMPCTKATMIDHPDPLDSRSCVEASAVHGKKASMIDPPDHLDSLSCAKINGGSIGSALQENQHARSS